MPKRDPVLVWAMVCYAAALVILGWVLVSALDWVFPW